MLSTTVTRLTNFSPVNKIFDYSIKPCFNFSDTYHVRQIDVSKYDQILQFGIIQLEVVTWKERYPIYKYGEEFVKKAEETRSIYENFQSSGKSHESLEGKLETVGLLEFSEQEGLLKLSYEMRKKLNITNIKFQVFDNDACIGIRLTRLILMTTNDFNAYLYKMIEDFISYRSSFYPRDNNIKPYDFFVQDRMKKGAKSGMLRYRVQNALAENKLKKFGCRYGNFFKINWNSIYELLVYWKRTLTFGFSSISVSLTNLLVLPYIAITVGKHCYSFLMQTAFIAYDFYSNISDRIRNPAQRPNLSHQHQNLVFTTIAGTIFMIFYALLGVEQSFATLYFEETIDLIFLIMVLEIFYSVVVRSETGRKWFPRFAYVILAFIFFKPLGYRNNKLVLTTAHLLVDCFCIFFYHHFELPLIDGLMPLSLTSLNEEQREGAT